MNISIKRKIEKIRDNKVFTILSLTLCLIGLIILVQATNLVLLPVDSLLVGALLSLIYIAIVVTGFLNRVRFSALNKFSLILSVGILLLFAYAIFARATYGSRQLKGDCISSGNEIRCDY